MGAVRPDHQWRGWPRREPLRALSACAEAYAGAQEFLGIDGFTVDPRFIMQMRSGGAARRADFADHLADLDHVADLDVDLREVAVAGGEPVAMVDFDHAAVAAAPTRIDNLAVGGGAYGITHLRAEIETRMHRGPSEEGIGTDAETGRELDLANHGLAVGHLCQRAGQLVRLRAGDVDPVKLAVKGAGVGGEFHGDERSAHRRARGCRLEVRHVETKIGDDAAHATYFRLQAIFIRVERRHLSTLNLVERVLQANQRIVDALVRGELARRWGAQNRRTRFEPRLAIGRSHEDHGVADRVRLWRSRRRFSRGTARR